MYDFMNEHVDPQINSSLFSSGLIFNLIDFLITQIFTSQCSLLCFLFWIPFWSKISHDPLNVQNVYKNLAISLETELMIWNYCSHFQSVIFIDPFKISTDNYHAVDDSALCACVYKQYDPATDKRQPFWFCCHMLAGNCRRLGHICDCIIVDQILTRLTITR